MLRPSCGGSNPDTARFTALSTVEGLGIRVYPHRLRLELAPGRPIR
jgi:hypothetical protein